MKSREEVLDQKNRIISQIKELVKISQKIIRLEKNKAANKEKIYALIMEYDGIMEDKKIPLGFHKKSPKHKKARSDFYQMYKKGVAQTSFSFFIYQQIKELRLAIKMLNFVLEPSSNVK